MADETRTYVVVRAQDGERVRAELDFETATNEAAILNAQARAPLGTSESGAAIYGSMHHGDIAQYEVRSADGLVIA